MNIATKIATQAVVLLIIPTLAFCKEKKSIDDHLQKISQMTDSLRKVKVEEYTESVVPPLVKELFPALKHELLSMVTETMNDEKFDWNSADELKNKLISKLKKIGITLPGNGSHESDYGSYGDITVEKPEHHEDLIAVSTTLKIICGEDTSFYLFKKEKDKWKIVFIEEANGYEEISGANGTFGYSISPPDKKGNFYIVTATVMPWCTSNWQAFNYKISRLGASASHPRVLLKKEESIYLGVDSPYRIDTEVDKFTLKFSGDWCSTPDAVTSYQSVTYKIGRNQVRRIKKHCSLEQ